MSPRLITLIAGILVPLIFGLFLLGGTFYTVDQGERVVVLTNGKITSVADAGWHYKLPIIEDTVTVSTRTGVRVYEALPTYSFDQQIATLRVSVNYRIDPTVVAGVYENYGGEEGIVTRILDPKVREQTKNVFGLFSAIRAIQERGKLNAEINAAIAESVSARGLIIESVQVENIDFEDGYEEAVEAAARAKANIEQAKSELLRVEQEAQQKVKQAEAEATAKKLQADADAYAVEANGKAQANAIEARGAALRNNPALVDLVTAERWDGVLPTTLVPGSALPFINVGK
ncbi:MAG TPA: SPFH domain-containing protein [Candidatus Obscuribacterales bacterium]